MKLKGELPVIRLTAIVIQGAISGRVRVLGPRGGGNRPSSALRKPSRTPESKRRGGPRVAAARLPKARAA